MLRVALFCSSQVKSGQKGWKTNWRWNLVSALLCFALSHQISISGRTLCAPIMMMMTATYMIMMMIMTMANQVMSKPNWRPNLVSALLCFALRHHISNWGQKLCASIMDVELLTAKYMIMMMMMIMTIANVKDKLKKNLVSALPCFTPSHHISNWGRKLWRQQSWWWWR